MGLLLDLSPDAGLDDSGGNEKELEAELLALIGGGGRGGKKEGGKGEIPGLKKQIKSKSRLFFLSFNLFQILLHASSRPHGGH